MKGVPETTEKVPIFDESVLRKPHAGAPPYTVDAWSPHFKWHVNLTAEEIECDIRATVQKLLADPEKAPFVVAPPMASSVLLIPLVLSVAGRLVARSIW